MPFRTSTTDPTVPQPVLQAVAVKDFQLLSPFVYVQPGTGTVFDVPAQTLGQTTDLASVPALLWGLVAPYGHQLLPALLHDHRCGVADASNNAGAPEVARQQRAEGDLLFRQSLAECHVPWTRRWVMWAAVSLDGYVSFDKLALVLSGLCLVIGLGCVWALPWFVSGVWVWLAVLAPAAAGFLPDKHLKIAGIGSYAGPVAVVTGVVNAVASALFWLVPGGVIWMVRKGLHALAPGQVAAPGQPPVFGPALQF